MLGLLRSDTEVGFYSAAIKVKTLLVSAITSLGAVLLPRSSYYVRQGRLEDVFQLTGKAVSFVLLTSLPLLFFFTLFAKALVKS
jgi:O-antigen/teichoic acid export membrane protein